MNDLPTDALTRAVGDLKARGFSVDAVPGDLSNSATAREVGLKGLECSAGSTTWSTMRAHPARALRYRPADLDALTDVFWDKILRINLLSAFWMTKTLARALTQAKGAVVNTSRCRHSAAAGAAPPMRPPRRGSRD